MKKQPKKIQGMLIFMLLVITVYMLYSFQMKKILLLTCVCLAGLVMLSLVVVIMHSHSFLMGQKMSMILRVISTAAIYQKVNDTYLQILIAVIVHFC